jgi:hypothetical protein
MREHESIETRAELDWDFHPYHSSDMTTITDRYREINAEILDYVLTGIREITELDTETLSKHAERINRMYEVQEKVFQVTWELLYDLGGGAREDRRISEDREATERQLSGMQDVLRALALGREQTKKKWWGRIW